MERREREDGVPYTTWAAEGHLEATPGDVVDYEYLRRRVAVLAERYDIREVAMDRWNASQVAVWLDHDGLVVSLFGQGFRSMSAPSKEFEAAVCGKRLRHGNHPVLRWNASVVSADTDAAANVKPSKKRSGERIDGVVATVMGIGRATACADDGGSVYDDRGLEML